MSAPATPYQTPEQREAEKARQRLYELPENDGRVVIDVENLGVEFLRARKRKISIRELVFKGHSSSPRDKFWVLRNINFQVREGEAVGLVGANGQGKSTLLKLIAGVLVPDEGKVTVTGGVAPMIELTGGFLGDLSARENIYLTAGLHGLSREQIDERFEGIVDFAGDQVRAGLDTPFRHFSSGMQVRLGFAVMTVLDEPIILVDEVLAVGDKAFREKCYRRMEMLLSEGRTLFLVSHSEADLKRFCRRGLYIKDSTIAMDGPIGSVLDAYEADVTASLQQQ